MDNELIEIKKEIEEKQLELQEKVSKPLLDIKKEIDKQYESNRKELADNKEFVGLTKQITERGARAELGEDMLDILDKEQKNDLKAYELKIEKDKLKYKQKKEKKIISEEVKAEVSNRRTEALKKRFGYMYKDGEEFIPNKFYNRQREITNWWKGTSDNFKKFVRGGLKIFLWVIIAFIVGFLGYKIVTWFAQNVYIPNLPQG